MLAADSASIEAALEYVTAPCGGAAVPIPGPECPRGVEAGTLIEVFPRSGCEFTYEPATTIGPVVQGVVVPGLALVAAYRTTAPSGTPGAPVGDYGLVFRDAEAALLAVAVNADGGIVGWTSSCGRTDLPDFLAELPVGTYILEPSE
jgi:hypothetical protein